MDILDEEDGALFLLTVLLMYNKWGYCVLPIMKIKIRKSRSVGAV